MNNRKRLLIVLSIVLMSLQAGLCLAASDGRRKVSEGREPSSPPLTGILPTESLQGLVEEARDSQSTRSFREMALYVPRRLLHTNIGDLCTANARPDFIDLCQFLGRFEHQVQSLYSIGWKYGTLLGGPNRRTAAVNIQSHKLVIWNMEVWLSVPDFVRPVLALHEALDVLGYDDANYEISISLWWMTVDSTGKNVDRFVIKPEVVQTIRTLKFAPREQRYQIAKGVSGVGGGGDAIGVWAKMQFLVDSEVFVNHSIPDEKEKAEILRRLRSNIIRSKIEVDYEHGFSETRLNTLDGVILIPSEPWSAGGERLIQLVNDVLTYLAKPPF